MILCQGLTPSLILSFLALTIAKVSMYQASAMADVDMADQSIRKLEFTNTGNYVLRGTELNGYHSNEHFGRDTDVSGNGKVLFVGAQENTEDNNSKGYVKVYDWSDDDNDWKPFQTIYSFQRGDRFGWAVASSFDGNTFAVSAQGRKIVEVYTRTASENKGEFLKSSIIPGVCPSSSCGFGRWLQMSPDGNIIGVFDDGGFFNSVWVYDGESATWVQRGDFNKHGNSGSLIMSGDGTIIGNAHYHHNVQVGNGQMGTYWIWKWDAEASKWVDYPGRVDTPTELATVDNAQWGNQAAMSYDGKTVVIGSANANKMFIYKYEEDNLVLKTSISPSGGIELAQLDISGNGEVIAAFSEPKVFIYKIKDGSWQQINIFEADDSNLDGHSFIKLSGDGSTVALGNFHYNSFKGRALVLYDAGIYNSTYDPVGPPPSVTEVFEAQYFITPSVQSTDHGSVKLLYTYGPGVETFTVDIMKKDCEESVTPTDLIVDEKEEEQDQSVVLSFGFDTSLLSQSNLLSSGSTNTAGTLEFCIFAKTYQNISLYGNDTTQETLMVMNMTNYALDYSGAQTGFFTVEDIQLSEVEATDGGDGGFSLGNMTLTTVLCSSSSTDEVFEEQTDTVFLCLISSDLDTKLDVTSLKVTYSLNENPVEMVLKNVETDYEADFISIEPVEGDHTMRIEVAIIAEFFAFGNTELDFSGFVDIGFVQASDVRQRFNEVESTDFGTKVIIATNEGCFGQLFTMVQNMF